MNTPPDRICAAIETLSHVQLLRVKRFAKLRLRALHCATASHDYEDLLSEAITRTLAGQYTWNKDVSFEDHLMGSIRHVSSEWSLEAGPDSTSENSCSDKSSRSGVPSKSRPAEEWLAAIAALFESDGYSYNLIDLLSQGYTTKEASTALRISETECLAMVARIRRKIELELPDVKSRLEELTML